MAVVIVTPLIAASISLSFPFFFFFFFFFFSVFVFGCGLDDSGGEFAMMDLCVREHGSCAYGE